MADQQPAPTEAQQHPMQEAADRAAGLWQGDFTDEQLTIPYKREASDEKEDDTSTDNPNAPDKDSEEEVTEELAEVEPAITVQDPGDYVPADYSFEVTDKDGKTVKISTPDEAEKFADNDDNFQSAKDLKSFLSKSQKMESKLDRDYEKWEERHETFTKQLETETERRGTVANYESEFNYLATKGLIPKLSPELQVANWQDPEVAKNEDVKVYSDILNYLVEENKLRAKANVKPMTSIVDAYNAWQLDTNRQKAVDGRKAAGEARKAAGSRVAGTSPAQQAPYVPKGIAVGRTGIFSRGNANWED